MPRLTNIKTLYQCRAEGSQSDVHAIDNAALVWEGENITWVGSATDLPKKYEVEEAIDAHGATVVPGFIDCHTHLCFGGWRADEFEQRVLGKSYLEIAKAGGGILSTVQATREASEGQLYQRCVAFLEQIYSLGVTTVEAKSGYGLSLDSELKILRIYKRLRENGHDIISTFLGAHTIPAEYREKRSQYIALVCKEMIPRVAEEKLALFCDVFIEDSAFTYEEAQRILETGKKFGLIPKIHADQLSDSNGAKLASEIGAVSADHLECISLENIERMASSGTVAVTLPLASLYTKQVPLNARPLLDAHIPVAIATDFNPGSAPSYHLPLAMMLGCTMNAMTPAETLKAATINAAKALGINKQQGSLEFGKQANFSLLNTQNVNELLYHFIERRCLASWHRGRKLFSASRAD